MATEVGTLQLKVDTSGVKSAEAAVERLGDAAQDTTQKTKIMHNQSKKGGVVVGDFGRKAGMAGVQLEQLAGQIAMGQNPMRAVGVQAADLGFVLGVPLLGAVVGIGAAIGSVLIPMLMDAEKSVEELEESLESIADVMAKNAKTGADVLSESLLKLARRSRDLAEIQLRVKMVDAMMNVTAAQKAMITSTEELVVVQHSFGQNVRSNPRLLRLFSEEMGISQQAALQLRDSIKAMQEGNEGAAQSVVSLINELLKTGETTPKFAQLAAGVLQAALNMDTAEEQVKFLKAALQDLDAALVDSASAFGTQAQAAEEYANRMIALTDTRRQAIDRQETERLDRLQEYRDADLISEQEYQEALASIRQNASQQRAQLEQSEFEAEVEKREQRLARLHEQNDREMQILIEADQKKKESAMQTTNALLSLEDTLLKGKSEKQKAGFRLAVNLMNAEKRENAKNIISNSYDAAMKAYKALAGIPFIGPALGAAAAATVLAAGVSYAAQSLSGRALGGQVRAGESYVVGERGPEILTMGSTGRITPNEAIGGSGQTVNKTANVQFSIAANDTQGFDELLSNRRGLIISMINEAMEDQGRVGIV